MDLVRLEKAQDLLKHSEATDVVTSFLKTINENTVETNVDNWNKIVPSLEIIKNDLMQKMIELKADYEREFAEV